MKKSKLPTKWTPKATGGAAETPSTGQTYTVCTESSTPLTATRTYTSIALPSTPSVSASTTPNVSSATTPRSAFSPNRKLSPSKVDPKTRPTGIQRLSLSRVTKMK